MECDFEINEAAEGVAVWKMGLPMTGLVGTRGKVDDFDIMEVGFFSLPEVVLLGRVLVLESKGIVVAVVVVGLGVGVTFAAAVGATSVAGEVFGGDGLFLTEVASLLVLF